jgi:hypothetical protein
MKSTGKAKEKIDAAPVMEADEVGDPYVTTKDDDYVLGIWYGTDGQSFDVLAQAWARGGKVEAVYRFRYYDEDDPGNDPWSGKDRKSGAKIGPKDDTPEERERICIPFQKLMDLMGADDRIRTWHYPGGPVDEAMDWLVAQPFAHVRKVDGAGKES